MTAGTLALSPTARCVCSHAYGEHALHADSGERVCVAYVPIARLRRPPAKPGEGVAGGCVGIPSRQVGGVQASAKTVLLSRMELCACESFALALCPHGEAEWRGCPACRQDEYEVRRGEREADA